MGDAAKRILILDDDQGHAQFLKRLLEESGQGDIAAELCVTGEECLDRLQKSFPVDLVLLELDTPGLRGEEVIRKVVQMEPPPSFKIVPMYCCVERMHRLDDISGTPAFRRIVENRSVAHGGSDEMNYLRSLVGLPEVPPRLSQESMMVIDPKVIVRFTHDAIKPVRIFLSRLELESMRPDAVPPLDEKACQTLIASLEGLRQAFEDLQGLAGCEMSQKEGWEVFDWTDRVREHTEMLRKKDPKFVGPVLPGTIPGRGKIALLQHALYNMAWFVRHFSNRLINFEYKEGTINGKKAIELAYEIETANEPAPGFCESQPFVPMSSAERTLQSNTGFILYTVKRIMEIHDGTLAIQSAGKKAILSLICPLGVQTGGI
jgi:CheY-like chemotaxis protein